jgi:hypothetical protein
VLREREQEIWDDVVRDHRAGHREPLPHVVVGGGWGAVLLLLFGMPSAALAVGTATALVWAVWRFLPQQADAPAPDQQAPEPGRRSRPAG